MSKHISSSWLGAYHDGALKGRRLRQIEAHLTQCASCRANLEQLRALSSLLQTYPVIERRTAPDRFVAQVGLQLERRPERTPLEKTLEIGWRLTPVALTGAWVFLQTVFIVSGVVLLVWRLGLEDLLLPTSQVPWWAQQLLRLVDGTTLETGRLIWQLWQAIRYQGFLIVLYVLPLALIVLLYGSWMASWWARRQHKDLIRS